MTKYYITIKIRNQDGMLEEKYYGFGVRGLSNNFYDAKTYNLFTFILDDLQLIQSELNPEQISIHTKTY